MVYILICLLVSELPDSQCKTSTTPYWDKQQIQAKNIAPLKNKGVPQGGTSTGRLFFLFLSITPSLFVLRAIRAIRVRPSSWIVIHKFTRKNMMSEKKEYQIQYINLCINKFAKKFGLMPHTAFKYLEKYCAIDFLTKHYEAEHVLPIEDTVDSLHEICHRNGGTL